MGEGGAAPSALASAEQARRLPVKRVLAVNCMTDYSYDG
jgi:hypothetical protein